MKIMLWIDAKWQLCCGLMLNDNYAVDWC